MFSRIGDQQQRPGNPQAGREEAERPCRHGDQPGDRREPRIPAVVALAEAVGEPAAGKHAGASADQQERRQEIAASMSRSRPKLRIITDGSPQRETVAAERAADAAKESSQKAGLRASIGKTLAERRRPRGPRAACASPTTNRRTGARARPAMPMTTKAARQLDRTGDVGADQRSPGKADRDAERKDRERPRAALGRKIIGDQRVGRGDSARFANADTEPIEEQLAKARGRAAERGERAPDRERAGDDSASARLVGEVGERDSERRIEQWRRRGRRSHRIACR